MQRTRGPLLCSSTVPHASAAYLQLASVGMPKHCWTFKVCACVACSSDCSQASKLCSSFPASFANLRQHSCCSVGHDVRQQGSSMQHLTRRRSCCCAYGTIQVCARGNRKHASFQEDDDLRAMLAEPAASKLGRLLQAALRSTRLAGSSRSVCSNALMCCLHKPEV